MRAFVVSAARTAGVEEAPAPVAGAGEVVVDVRRAGVCGTDLEIYSGQMQYLRDGVTTYPVRIGHEWCGVVAATGEGVDRSLIGRRVTGDTMLGCGRCRRCLAGRQHLCESRGELGIRGGRPGALAEQVAVPASSLHALPDTVDDTVGALVEPGGNALRAVLGADPSPGERVLVTGPGTIGLLCAMFARDRGAEVHLLGRDEHSLAFARSLGFQDAWTENELPELPWDAVIDASNATHLPAKALDLVEPGGRIAYIGLAVSPSVIDTRTLVLKDVTAVGVLSASPAIAATIALYAEGAVDPRPLVAAVVGLDEVAPVLNGDRPANSGPGPKIQVDITASQGGQYD